ncbi:AAA family ATPase [Candidatus Amarolinea dominans]|uniref:ATP-dependent nuclease n=1 Tax=Candidatus Amarolinea dominans TaxID=3140696 RepID=UPI003136771C|nr:AAA family ATPase [Anaerolineae bacterium]
MITRLTLHNFKSIGTQTYEFTQFDLLVGRNNSGKSTVLQALAIWQFCVDEFHRSKRTGSKGIQVVLPNFTALPVPEFNLLWKDRTDRHWPLVNGAKKQEYILIGIRVEWRRATGETDSFGVQLRYHSPQAIYAIPGDGWAKFRTLEQQGDLPIIAYVPPFSGLEPTEKWLDVSPLRQQVGKGQPGSVLRNLLLRVCPPPLRGEDGRAAKGYTPPADWREVADVIDRWFSVEIHEPKYDSARDVNITVEYRQNGKDYDIIAQGSGFHQTLTLLAFLYGYHPTTSLLDEPDAHLHVNLQREILDYFKRKSLERNIQFLIATHAEEFVRGVDPSQIVSLLNQVPTRPQSAPNVLRAMAEVSNEEIMRLMTSPYILYVEGESDERILRAWASQCGAQDAVGKVCFKAMSGGSKKDMKVKADEHFAALQQIIPGVARLMLFDYDSSENAFHPDPNNPALAEWKRKNIENYLLVSDAWKRAALKQLNIGEGELFALPVLGIIDEFFTGQNLTLPPGRNWRSITANVFSVVDGKRILFENDDSLFHQLRNAKQAAQLLREQVAAIMTIAEIHEDVHRFFSKLVALTKPVG